MQRRRRKRRNYRLPMAVIGLFLLPCVVVMAVALVFTYAPLLEFLIAWSGWLILAVGVFGLAFPLAHGGLLVFSHRGVFGSRPAWLSSAFLTIHWLVYVPFIGFVVGPAFAAFWPCADMQDRDGKVFACIVFALGAALPAQFFLAGHWPFPARPARVSRGWTFPTPLPHIRLRRQRAAPPPGGGSAVNPHPQSSHPVL